MNAYTPTQKAVLIACLCLFGCVTSPPAPPNFYNDLASHMEHDTAVSMNWLAIAGAVTIAFGVATFMNGQKAATSILAAGITLLAIGIITTQALCIFADLRKYALYALIALGIAGFFVFTHTSLDQNGDGKFDWQDIRAVFLKIRRKLNTT
jgi:hypothetical protein